MSSPEIELEIFILTHNRAEMLKTAIKNCLGQTIGRIPITILDNASTDHTADIVAAFDEPNIRYLPSERNIGAIANVQRCQKLCTGKHVMIFHDDDQLRPTYLKRALDLLHDHPDANVIVSNASTIPAQSTPDFSVSTSTAALKLDRAHFAGALYVRNKVAFCSAVYRRDALKSLDFEDLNVRFGKWGDRPIMIEAVGEGSAILLSGTYVFSGRHDSQDTHTKNTQPPHTVWLNRERYFRDQLGDSLSSILGACFCVMSHRRLKSGYKRRITKGVSFTKYLNDAFEMGAATKRTWRLRWMAPRVIQRGLEARFQKHLFRNFSITP